MFLHIKASFSLVLNQFHRVPWSVCCQAIGQRLIVDAQSNERVDVGWFT